MADDDAPTSPGAPIPPFDEDGPTLQVHLPDSDDADPTVPLVPAFVTDDVATLRRPHAVLVDDVATTRLEPVPIPSELHPDHPPSSEQTRPFVLTARAPPSDPVASVPFPLVSRDTDVVATARMPATADLRLAAPVLPMPHPQQHPPVARSDSRALLAFTASVLATLALALVVVVAVMALRRASSSAPPTAAPAPQPGAEGMPGLSEAPGPAQVAAGCVLARPARMIADSILPSVPPSFAPALSPGQLAVGVAESRNAALGLVVDLEVLSSERRFSQSFTRPVLRTTPFERDGSTTFLVDHYDPRLLAARTVPATTPFLVGVNYFGFARAAPTGEPETLWPGGKGNPISEPVFAHVPGVGYAVAFVRGRFAGSAHVGWLSERGQARTDLGTLDQSAYELGAPSVAAGERAIAVTLPMRSDRGSPWRVQVASAAHGQLPRKLEPTSTGMGPDRSEPAIVALADDRWLLSWIEAAADGRRVRAQILDANLRGVGAPFDIANQPGIVSARGALYREAGRVLSFYVLRGERGFELWCAALACS
jgi:hypothetical protein